MAKVLDRSKPFQELHVNQNPKKGVQGGIFLIQGKEAFNFDGTPIAPGKIWICQICADMHYTELDFAKHMVEKHPKPKAPEAKSSRKNRNQEDRQEENPQKGRITDVNYRKCHISAGCD